MPEQPHTLVVRPQIPMALLVGVPWCAALGVVDALRATGATDVGIAWPHDVVVGGAPALSLAARGGYDDRGMFVRLALAAAGDVSRLSRSLLGRVDRAIAARLGVWERGVAAHGPQAGPLAPFLSEYFDLVHLMGRPVEVVHPNGRIFDRGTLAGIDAWGRAAIRRPDGSELEVAPEQARLRAVR